MEELKLPRGIRKKSNGKYIVDVCISGVRKTATCGTLDKALKIQSTLRLELTDFSSYGVNNTCTLAQACQYCVLTRWKTARNKGSMQTKINVMLDYFGGETLISDITTRHIDAYAGMLQSKYKAGTVNLYLSGLSAVLRTAYDREMIEKLPKIPHIKNRAHRMRFLSDNEERDILQYFSDDNEMSDIISVLLDTGMRKGELFSLSKSDVNIQSNLITVWESKTGVSRSIPMTDRVKCIMSRRMSNNNFFNITQYNFTKLWEKMRNTLGFSKDGNFVPHILRHTCCSRLVQRGAEIVKVSKWMGHNSIATTMIYAHLAPDSLMDMKVLLER